MKKILALLLVVSLSGCATISEYWPRSHDSDLAILFVDAKMNVDMVDCKHSEYWDEALYLTKRMATYATFRQDPQAANANSAFENLGKARLSLNACDRYLNVVKLRLEVIAKSWGTR